jgi:serine O-acetyltransferase
LLSAASAYKWRESIAVTPTILCRIGLIRVLSNDKHQEKLKQYYLGGRYIRHMPDRRKLKRAAEIAGSAFMTPLLIPYAVTDQKHIILEDVNRWSVELDRPAYKGLCGLLCLAVGYPEFRSLYFHRLRCGNLLGAVLSVFLKLVYRGRTALYLNCSEIGPGLFLQHAWSTGVGAKSIGRNCWINQQVTIGHVDRTHGPIIGDNVYIHAGAKVLGPIRIGNNVRIGANALVLKDIPDDSVVIGSLPSVIRKPKVESVKMEDTQRRSA